MASFERLPRPLFGAVIATFLAALGFGSSILLLRSMDLAEMNSASLSYLFFSSWACALIGAIGMLVVVFNLVTMIVRHIARRLDRGERLEPES